MDEKRERRQMLLIYVAIGVVAAVITGWFLYQNRMEFWKTQARSAFRVALGEELQKRNEIGVYFSSSGNIRLPDDSIDIKKELVKVHMENEYGEKDFFIPYEKHSHNVEQSFDLRGMHSYILHVSPLKVDSLHAIWKNLLAKIGFAGKTTVRISVADWNEHEIYTFSDDSLHVAKSDSLISCYLGYRCEIGVTGYMLYPWLKVLTPTDKVLLCALALCGFLLFFIQEYIIRLYRYFFAKRVEVVMEKEVPIVVKEEIPVIVTDRIESHVYQIEEGLCFDADSRILKNAVGSVKMMPLPAKLLRGFLDAKDFKLSNGEIMNLLWPDGNGTLGNLHTNIKRLRGYLSQMSSCTIENENYSYQLKKPHFIEESPV